MPQDFVPCLTHEQLLRCGTTPPPTPWEYLSHSRTPTSVVMVGWSFTNFPESTRLLARSLKHPTDGYGYVVSYQYTLMAFRPPQVSLASPAQEKSHLVGPSLLGLSDDDPQKHCSTGICVQHRGSRGKPQTGYVITKTVKSRVD